MHLKISIYTHTQHTLIIKVKKIDETIEFLSFLTNIKRNIKIANKCHSLIIKLIYEAMAGWIDRGFCKWFY